MLVNVYHHSYLFKRFFFFFNDTATTEIYTLSLHDALPIAPSSRGASSAGRPPPWASSVLPPPRPDSAPFTRSVADRPRSRAAGLTATTSDALPPERAATATTPGRPAGIRPRISCARVRTSFAPAPSGASVPT